MDHTIPDHRLPIKDFVHTLTVERMAAPLSVLHSGKGQMYLVAGARHMNARKILETLLAIDRDPCGAVHHMIMPRGSSGRCDKKKQNNTLSCAHGSQLPLQQALVAAALFKVIQPEVLQEYVAIRTIQEKVLLDADDLLTSGYAHAARGREDDKAQNHRRRMGLPVVGVKTSDVHDWMCGKQAATSAPLIAIIDAVIDGLRERFPALRDETAAVAAPAGAGDGL